MDIAGFFLAPVAFVLLALSMNVDAFQWLLWILRAVSVILLVWLWFHETRHPQPILALQAFRKVSFRRGIFVSWVQYAALNGSLVFIPQYLQHFKGYSPFQAGLVMSMVAITSGLLMPVGRRLFDKVGIRPLAGLGLGTISLALLLLS
ncbi:MFS transporter [Paenibacillus sp. PastH-2]|uniref:MFS transporter n=1 Tax=Paenibacillus sp. PastH-2 TaxID=2940530 RepID=UPI0024732A38|nr:MFS transporter [Paenibacillus sp. PastH-2]